MQQDARFQDYLIFWLRWLILLPTSIVAAILVSFPIHWAVLLATSPEHCDAEGCTYGVFSFLLSLVGPETLERLAIAFAAPIAFIFAGAWVAPVGKLHAAALLTIVWFSFLFFAIAYVNLSDKYAVFNWLEAGISLALGVAGAGLGGYLTYKRNTRLRWEA